MKRFFILLNILVLIVSCTGSNEEKAEARLDAARTALEREDFNGAKLQIDSIKILYPKEYQIRKAGQDLLCAVVIKEQQHNLRYLTSTLLAKQQELEVIKGKYTLEKDKRYQEVGNYFWPTQTVERNLRRSFLRFQVNEQGIMTVTSIYHGKRFIDHNIVKVIAPDGTFAETPTSGNVYRDSYSGIKFEQADFHYGQDGGVIKFLFSNRTKNIRVEFIGKKTFVMNMIPSDREALFQICQLTTVLTAIQKTKAAIDDANVKIKFVMKKQQYDAKFHR
jgi:hypothetical protein